MLNSAFLVIANIIGALLSVPVIAYGFARFNFPFKNVLFILMLSMMMVPGHIKLIPLYVLYLRLDLIDTYWPLILAVLFWQSLLHLLDDPIHAHDSPRTGRCRAH